jgi:hypothetical protein
VVSKKVHDGIDTDKDEDAQKKKKKRFFICAVWENASQEYLILYAQTQAYDISDIPRGGVRCELEV